ncbi:hypothetical protein OESDEN_12692 [Oesophagostomum dentatum]|uniref:Uncharacterized protein n=1 Tax=Oesophagostomum dentatum TaxID=61180 RepID=A0A0B1SVI6_OESDE|nr:hypothetical protein OESDEN_12692 [Oesophagostomum dentatum]
MFRTTASSHARAPVPLFFWGLSEFQEFPGKPHAGTEPGRERVTFHGSDYSRMVTGVLIMVNFGNSIILSLEAFGPDSALSFTIFLLNTVIVALAMYGIFAFKPIFLTPNVISKVSLSSAALFHGLQEAESNDSASVFHFIWLLLSVCLFIWEIHAMFSATFGVMKEMKLRAYSKPPPSYNQVCKVLGIHFSSTSSNW